MTSDVDLTREGKEKKRRKEDAEYRHRKKSIGSADGRVATATNEVERRGG